VAAVVSINGGVPEDVLGRAHKLLRVLLAQSSNVVINVGSFLSYESICKSAVIMSDDLLTSCCFRGIFSSFILCTPARAKLANPAAASMLVFILAMNCE
jgi:hypothetical protein